MKWSWSPHRLFQKASIFIILILTLIDSGSAENCSFPCVSMNLSEICQEVRSRVDSSIDPNLTRVCSSTMRRCQTLPEANYSRSDTENSQARISDFQRLTQLLSQGMSNMPLKTHNKSAILVMGNTGSGKTTLSLTLNGNLNELHAVRTKYGKLVIIDDHEKIGIPSTKSKTLVPDYIVNPYNNQAFYDCPGFNDNRGPVSDLASMYLLKTLTEQLEQVKFLLTVPRSSMVLGEDRNDFDLLCHHVASMLLDMDKMKNSIGVVLTKVNSFTESGDYLEDNEILEQTQEFLQNYLNNLETKWLEQSDEETSEDERGLLDRQITLAKALLRKDENGKLAQVWFVRNPPKCGAYAEMPEHVSNIHGNITNLYENQLEWADTAPEDFGFTLHPTTKLKISRDFLPRALSKLGDDASQQGSQLMDQYKREVIFPSIFPATRMRLTPAECRAIWRTGIKSLSEQIQNVTLFMDTVNLATTQHSDYMENLYATMGKRVPEGYLASAKQLETWLQFFETVARKKGLKDLGELNMIPVDLVNQLENLREEVKEKMRMNECNGYISVTESDITGMLDSIFIEYSQKLNATLMNSSNITEQGKAIEKLDNDCDEMVGYVAARKNGDWKSAMQQVRSQLLEEEDSELETLEMSRASMLGLDPIKVNSAFIFMETEKRLETLVEALREQLESKILPEILKSYQNISTTLIDRYVDNYVSKLWEDSSYEGRAWSLMRSKTYFLKGRPSDKCSDVAKELLENEEEKEFWFESTTPDYYNSDVRNERILSNEALNTLKEMEQVYIRLYKFAKNDDTDPTIVCTAEYEDKLATAKTSLLEDTRTNVLSKLEKDIRNATNIELTILLDGYELELVDSLSGINAEIRKEAVLRLDKIIEEIYIYKDSGNLTSTPLAVVMNNIYEWVSMNLTHKPDISTEAISDLEGKYNSLITQMEESVNEFPSLSNIAVSETLTRLENIKNETRQWIKDSLLVLIRANISTLSLYLATDVLERYTIQLNATILEHDFDHDNSEDEQIFQTFRDVLDKLPACSAFAECSTQKEFYEKFKTLLNSEEDTTLLDVVMELEAVKSFYENLIGVEGIVCSSVEILSSFKTDFSLLLTEKEAEMEKDKITVARIVDLVKKGETKPAAELLTNMNQYEYRTAVITWLAYENNTEHILSWLAHPMSCKARISGLQTVLMKLGTRSDLERLLILTRSTGCENTTVGSEFIKDEINPAKKELLERFGDMIKEKIYEPVYDAEYNWKYRKAMETFIPEIVREVFLQNNTYFHTLTQFVDGLSAGSVNARQKSWSILLDNLLPARANTTWNLGLLGSKIAGDMKGFPITIENSPELRDAYRNLKNRIPNLIKTLVWGGKCAIKNTHLNEYLYVSQEAFTGRTGSGNRLYTKLNANTLPEGQWLIKESFLRNHANTDMLTVTIESFGLANEQAASKYLCALTARRTTEEATTCQFDKEWYGQWHFHMIPGEQPGQPWNARMFAYRKKQMYLRPSIVVSDSVNGHAVLVKEGKEMEENLWQFECEDENQEMVTETTTETYYDTLYENLV